jgi:hypothetical protein
VLKKCILISGTNTHRSPPKPDVVLRSGIKVFF